MLDTTVLWDIFARFRILTKGKSQSLRNGYGLLKKNASIQKKKNSVFTELFIHFFIREIEGFGTTMRGLPTQNPP